MAQQYLNCEWDPYADTPNNQRVADVSVSYSLDHKRTFVHIENCHIPSSEYELQLRFDSVGKNKFQLANVSATKAGAWSCMMGDTQSPNKDSSDEEKTEYHQYIRTRDHWMANVVKPIVDKYKSNVSTAREWHSMIDKLAKALVVVSRYWNHSLG